MGLLNAVTGFFGTSNKTIETGARIAEKATDGIIAGLDKLKLTDEEKLDYAQKATETTLEFWKTFANENSQQSKARRELAILFARLFALAFGIGTGLVLIDKKDMLDMYVDFLSSLSLGWIMSAVITTYFVPHQISKIWKGKNVK